MKLYHGSAFKSTNGLLIPGFEHTGELVEWDLTESNKFLYFTTSERSAIELGLMSALEKAYLLDRVQIGDDKTFTIVSPTKINRKKVMEVNVYLYVLDMSSVQGVVKVHNEHNQMKDEYKTDKSVPFVSVKKIDIETYFSDYTFVFK